MALEQDTSGLTMYNVMGQSRLLATVLMTAGAHTIVITTRTCPSRAQIHHIRQQLRRRRRLAAVRVEYISWILRFATR